MSRYFMVCGCPGHPQTERRAQTIALAAGIGISHQQIANAADLTPHTIRAIASRIDLLRSTNATARTAHESGGQSHAVEDS